MSEALPQVLRGQAAFCRTGGSPFTADVLDAACADLDAPGSPFAALLAPWAEADLDRLVEEAVALRLTGALHALVLQGVAPELAAAYPPAHAATDLAARLAAAARDHADRLAAFMTSPPQTNEVRRAMGLFAGFAAVAERTGLPLSTFEIGASAGLLTSWDAFHFAAADGAWSWGEADARVRLDAEWRGPPPPLGPIVVQARRACDVAPVRLADPKARLRLEAYVWPDQPDRLQRLRAAAVLALDRGVEVERADAGAWLTEHLQPQPGVATVLCHSVMFQYLPPASRAAVQAAIVRASAAATSEAPFAWLRFEPAAGELASRTMEVRLALWPSGGERLLARAQPHGAWIEHLGAEAAGAAG